ncbi:MULTISPECIES: PA2169 family four-helix-bundle protein [unclassified Lysobacter]|uniref:PA2169 family four-helix-bundle protein n=1 Tax=unclassified Lysobacter TaxID=2635362 RepID=UPI001BEB3A3B|nr:MULTISPECIES: PA2169 family four-helix-bundle protein [unclassified Lysobacter]MBT2744804.1 PA2169 family four-helix-bundle protein [Lysobacter sp. ISL-42]MBT2752203.1 PA2169 family four-helix-bundle protein [Lysobacter sp. ISL-50]MBT2778700.1 PA2169 family four-helix-bundle protein [Lysobacter sp. ISL-54]MBT2780369.1 PA2169 family four-helix-bundle protein [Lysobacter sp. ISL-52]
MNNQAQIAHNLNDLIEIARDGKDFYDEAAQKVKDAELSALFVRIAGVKADIVDALSSAVVAAGGKPAEHGTFVGSMQQFYGKVRATLGDTQYGYVAELEESEDRLLKAFNDTLSDADTPAPARAEVERLLPQVRECHKVMSLRKQALKAAS